MAAVVNIRRDVKDKFYRYKCVPPSLSRWQRQRDGG